VGRRRVQGSGVREESRGRGRAPTQADITHLPPEPLAESILKKEQRIAELMAEIKSLLVKKP
jgi:hypothetical protein